jgi:hypothetical protein
MFVVLDAADILNVPISLMMCSKKDIPQKAEWDGAAGESRQELLDGLQGQQFLTTICLISAGLANMVSKQNSCPLGSSCLHVVLLRC